MEKSAVKKVSELTFEEFKKYAEKNGYTEDVQKMAWSDADFHAEEILSYFEYNKAVYTSSGMEYRKKYCIDFEIDGSGYRYSYIKPARGCGGYIPSDDLTAVVNALKELNSAMCINSEPITKKIERISERLDFYIDASAGYEDISEEKYDLLDCWINDGIQEALDEVLQYILSDYEYYSEYENAIELAWELEWLGDSDTYCDFENDYAEITLTEPETLYHVNGKTFKTYSEMATEYNRTHENAIPLF